MNLADFKVKLKAEIDFCESGNKNQDYDDPYLKGKKWAFAEVLDWIENYERCGKIYR